MTPGHAIRDVAIYSPHASQLYEQRPAVSGGAELQTVILATALAEHGLQVAHIVLPLETQAGALPEGVELVQREPFAAGSGLRRQLTEIGRIWRCLASADAKVYVVRSSWAALAVVAALCALRRRRLVWASASDLDFGSSFFRGRRVELEMFRFGVRRADLTVVQTEQQAGLYREAFGSRNPVVRIPSFARLAEPSREQPQAFLWTGRLERLKAPIAYVELARSVPEAHFWMIPKFVEESAEYGEQVQAQAAELSNLELLDARPHAELMSLVERSVAIVNTSPAEGMPNTFLEAWARGIPVLTLDFDPDGQVAGEGLGVAAGGSPERFAEGARALWKARDNRVELSRQVRDYLQRTHGPTVVGDRWTTIIGELLRGEC